MGRYNRRPHRPAGVEDIARAGDRDLENIVWVGKYLSRGFRRIEEKWSFGIHASMFRVCSGWARTHESTIGGLQCTGLALYRACMISHWSSIQKTDALSSAEAEPCAATTALSEAKG